MTSLQSTSSSRPRGKTYYRRRSTNHFIKFFINTSRMVLNADILWEVLMTHIQDGEISASARLACVKSCSQVCSLWRHLILGWPSIWGKLIVMDHNQNKDWMEEVLRRSQPCPLHLSAKFLGGKLYSDRESNIRELFYTAVEENWDRIQVFSLTILGELSIVQMNRNLWSTFQRPAPLLQDFHIRVLPHGKSRQEWQYLLDNSITSLFSNNAPFLRRFKSPLRHVSFHNPPKWSQALHTLSMSHSNGMSLDKIMETLQHTSSLESFHTDSLAFGQEDFERRHTAAYHSLNLPWLRDLRLHMTLHQFVVFISRAKMSQPGCYNVQCTIHVPGYIDLTEVFELLRGFNKAFNELLTEHKRQHSANSKKPLCASFKSSSTGNMSLTWTGPASDATTSFMIEMQWPFPQSSIQVEEGMKEAYLSFVSTSLEDVSELSVTLDDADNHLMHRIPFLQSFSSASTLRIHGTTFFESFWTSLRSRRKADPTIPYPLRTVHTLQISLFSTWIDLNSSLLFDFFDFLRDREDQGIPIHRLQLLEKPIDFISLARAIEHFEDLEIFWKDKKGRVFMYSADCPEPVTREEDVDLGI